MTTDTIEKSPRRETIKSETTQNKPIASYDRELTEEQLQGLSGGGGDPTIVRD